MALDEHYICQRAANAIISEIGPFRISTDALQAINQFLDEFIVLLLNCSLSLDLSQIKSTVFNLLPSTLGKNAIVEAELEVKTFTETEPIDYDLYERMRKLGQDNHFPLEQAIALLREKCFEYCTLADKDDQMHLHQRRNEANMKVVISPIVAIYVATIMEHVAEYLLTAVAMTAEHDDTDYVRVKEVFLALIDDIQLGNVFQKMSLKDKMEKRAGLFQNQGTVRTSYLPPIHMDNRKSFTTDHDTDSFLDISFDDLGLDYFEEDIRKSTLSINTNIPGTNRPQSTMAHNTVRKSTFHLFKNNRNSLVGSSDVPPRASSPVSVYDSDLPVMDFDDLIRSGETVKVSLTPNRLRSIEIRDQTKDELILSQPKWERRSTSSHRLSDYNLSRPSSPLARHNTDSMYQDTKVKKIASKTTSISSTASISTRSSEDYQHKLSFETQKINHQALQPPSSPLSKRSFTVTNANKFENPRDAPKPPITPLAALPQLINVASHKNRPVATPLAKDPCLENNYKALNTDLSTTTPGVKQIKPVTKLQSTATSPAPSYAKSTHTLSSVDSDSTDSVSSTASSVASIPSSIVVSTPSSTKNITSIASLQESPLITPQVLKSNNTTTTINTNGMVIRRSSVSSRKSRESLRKMKEDELLREQSSKTEPLPTVSLAEVQNKDSQDIVHANESESTYSHNNNRQVSFDRAARNSNSTVINDSLSTVTIDITTSPSAITSNDEVKGSVTPTDITPGNINDVSFTKTSINEAEATNSPIPRRKITALSPERPSSMVAKRASMLGNNRRRSLHESYATEKYHQDILLRQRISTVGSVSSSIKQWDDILKVDDQIQQQPTTTAVVPPAAHRRSVLRQLRQQHIKEQDELQKQVIQQSSQPQLQPTSISVNGSDHVNNSNAVLDKVLKFERALSSDDFTHHQVSHMPRRERFLYLQQDPTAIERKSSILTAGQRRLYVKPLVYRALGVDQGTQTDFSEDKDKTLYKKENKEEEQGEIEGDEEWFLQGCEWDDQEEAALVEWLLGE